MEQKARRRRVPAFGEWNYSYYGSSAELATPAAPAELEARSDVWFKYSPPPRKPPPPPLPPASRKVRRLAADRSACGGSGKRPRAATPARASDAVVPSSSSVPRTLAKSSGAARARVVRRVDADLYQVPLPDLVHDEDLRPRRKNKASSRSLWMGCFGFSCVPAD